MLNLLQMMKTTTRASVDLPAGAAAVARAAGDIQSVAERVSLESRARVVLHQDPNGPAADRFRYLRMRLKELRTSANLRTLLVSSPLPNDGKSTIVMNLATALAENGDRKVLVVEADLHHATLCGRLGLPASPGIAEYLESRDAATPSVRKLGSLGWHFLPAGAATSNPTELVQLDRMRSLMHKLASTFDWVVIDSPPVLPVADALSLAQMANATLLVARAGVTPREAIEDSVRLLGLDNVLGVILNGGIGVNQLYANYKRYYELGSGKTRSQR
jgi:capsular exopolysaccharide synthesis family protein